MEKESSHSMGGASVRAKIHTSALKRDFLLFQNNDVTRIGQTSGTDSTIQIGDEKNQE